MPRIDTPFAVRLFCTDRRRPVHRHRRTLFADRSRLDECRKPSYRLLDTMSMSQPERSLVAQSIGPRRVVIHPGATWQGRAMVQGDHASATCWFWRRPLRAIRALLTAERRSERRGACIRWISPTLLAEVRENHDPIGIGRDFPHGTEGARDSAVLSLEHEAVIVAFRRHEPAANGLYVLYARQVCQHSRHLTALIVLQRCAPAARASVAIAERAQGDKPDARSIYEEMHYPIGCFHGDIAQVSTEEWPSWPPPLSPSSARAAFAFGQLQRERATYSRDAAAAFRRRSADAALAYR